MPNTHLGTAQFQILQARSCCNFLIEMTSKFQHHNAQPTTARGEVEMYWILLSIRIYSPGGGGDVLDIVVHKNIRHSNVIMSDILDSDDLPIIFHILYYVKTKNMSAPLEKFTDWEQFQSPASNLISPRLEIKSGVEADKAARDLTASIASAYRLATSKTTLTDLTAIYLALVDC
jgi:hypothetical protein